MDRFTQKEQEIQKLTTELGSTKAEVLRLQEGLEKSNRKCESLNQTMDHLNEKKKEVQNIKKCLERSNGIIEEQKRDLEKNSNETTEVRREYEVCQALFNAAVTTGIFPKSLWVSVIIKNTKDIEGFDMCLEFPNDIASIESLICKTANEKLPDRPRRSIVNYRRPIDSSHIIPFTVCRLISVETEAKERYNPRLSLCVTLH